jgi:type IV pilus assembly protein PilX
MNHSKARQRGFIVYVALIALLILSLAALALLRTSDTAGVIAGNLAFKQAATGAADTGAERAFNELPALATAEPNVDVANKYYSLMQEVDEHGVPNSINWVDVPCWNTAGNPIACTDAASYRVQYVIDRLCAIAPAAGDAAEVLARKCVSGQPFSTAGSTGPDNSSHAQTTHTFGGMAAVPTTRPTIHYRVTVRVQGPRNTASTVQTVVELPFG